MDFYIYPYCQRFVLTDGDSWSICDSELEADLMVSEIADGFLPLCTYYRRPYDGEYVVDGFYAKFFRR